MAGWYGMVWLFILVDDLMDCRRIGMVGLDCEWFAR
jgi:hypothetical protein